MAAVTEAPMTAEEQAAAFTRLYEARAYLIYNVALRITCERKTAMSAAETAFLRQAEPGADEAALLPATVSAALGHAARKPKPNGVGEAELPLLRAAATLAPPERAVLALAVMADVATDELGAVLDVGAEQGAQLLERALAGFGEAAGLDAGAVYDAYVEWGWAEPPAELWERVYPQFRRAAERAVATSADEATQISKPERAKRRGARLRAGWRRLLVAFVATGATAAGLIAILGPSQPDAGVASPTAVSAAAPASVANVPASEPAAIPEASSQGEPQDPVEAVKSKFHKPLTPQELDQLRLKELEALRNYQRRETDKRLTEAQRNYAANKVAAIRALARERAQVQRDAKRVARRERALERERARMEAQRRREAQQKAHQEQGSTQTAQPRPQPQQSSSGSQGGKSSGDNGDSPPTSTQAEETCVQDQDTGAYICPQG